MVLRCPNVFNTLGSMTKTVNFDFLKGTPRRPKASSSCGDFWFPATNAGSHHFIQAAWIKPLDVFSHQCLRLILWPVYKLAVSKKCTSPCRSMSSGVCKMLSFRGKRKVHLSYVFGNAFGRLQSETFLNPGTDTTFFKRPHLVRDLNTSIKALQYDLRKSHMAKSCNRKLFFDTHAMVRLLEEHGFSSQQAEVIVTVMVNTTNINMEVMYNDMVTKTQQEIMLQKVMSQIAAVKKDMIILERSEFSTLLAENEKVKIELLQLKMQLADVMNKVRADVMLDMNMEKSRVKEMRAEHEKKLLETRNEMMEMNAEQDCHVTQTNMKIDTEVAGLKTMLESHKLDTIKYLAGSVFTCLTVVLGFYRIWM